MSEFKKFYQKWLERVNEEPDMLLLERLSDDHNMVIEYKGKYYTYPKSEWAELNKVKEEKERVKVDEWMDVQQIFVTPPKNPINLVVWDEKKVDLPFSKVEHLEKYFNLSADDLSEDDLFRVIPDAYQELPYTHYPRKWFPFRSERDGDGIWYMNIEDGTYALYLDGMFNVDELPSLEKFHAAWLKRVNSPIDIDFIKKLISIHEIVVEYKGRYFIDEEQHSHHDSWLVFNNDPVAEIKKFSKGVDEVFFEEIPENPINLVVWDEKEVVFPYSKVEHLSKYFNLDIKELDDFFVIIPEIQNDVPHTHNPRKWFPFLKQQKAVWYVNVEDGRYGVSDKGDDVFGFFIHKKPPPSFSYEYRFGKEGEDDEYRVGDDEEE